MGLTGEATRSRLFFTFSLIVVDEILMEADAERIDHPAITEVVGLSNDNLQGQPIACGTPRKKGLICMKSLDNE
jgi:hypothetical protein